MYKINKNKNKAPLMIAYVGEDTNPIFKEAQHYGGWEGGFSERIVTPCFPLGYNSLSALSQNPSWTNTD